jgi:hypothetical protein
MDHDDGTPEWIKRERERRQKAAATKVGLGGARFFGELLDELSNNTKALPEIGAYGKTSNLSVPGEAQLRCRVDVGLKGSPGGITYTDLFYTEGGTKIESRTMEDDICGYGLCQNPSKAIAAVEAEGFEMMSAAQLAERIVREAIERLECATA